MAENELRCNNLRSCRKLLAQEGRAVVTTCSHIFCLDCANHLFGVQRKCPACDTFLDQPDDITTCLLNPSNDYRTSVLSGLTPSIIMEIAGRALSFWSYQTTQEAAYQALLLSKSQEYNAVAKQQLQNTNAEINALNSRTISLERELDIEKRKNLDLVQSGKDKEKEYNRLKAQYDKIKQRAILHSTNVNDDLMALPVSGLNIGSSRQSSVRPGAGGVGLASLGVGTGAVGMDLAGSRPRVPFNPDPTPRNSSRNSLHLSNSQTSRSFQPNNDYNAQPQSHSHRDSQQQPIFDQKIRSSRGDGGGGGGGGARTRSQGNGQNGGGGIGLSRSRSNGSAGSGSEGTEAGYYIVGGRSRRSGGQMGARGGGNGVGYGVEAGGDSYGDGIGWNGNGVGMGGNAGGGVGGRRAGGR